MAITPYWYGQGLLHLCKGNVDLDTDTFKLTLHTDTYTPNQDTHDYYDDATNELSTASGYTSGGVALSSTALSYDSTTNQVRWDFADPSWAFTGSQTWRYGVIRKSRGGAASADELLCYLAWDSNQTVSTTYTLTIDSLGLLYIAAA